MLKLCITLYNICNTLSTLLRKQSLISAYPNIVDYVALFNDLKKCKS